MRSRGLPIAASAILFCGIFAFAQTQPNLENGYKPYGSYDGSSIDSVVTLNGNLILDVPAPIPSPQRGSLTARYVFYLSSKNWSVQCVPDPQAASGLDCQWTPGVSAQCIMPYQNVGSTRQVCAFPSGVNLTNTLALTVKRTAEVDHTGDGPVLYSSYGYSVVSWDLAVHQLYPVPGTTDSTGEATQFESVDGTGYRVQMSNPGSSGVLDSVTIKDRSGNQYQGTFPDPGNCVTTFGRDPWDGVKPLVLPNGGTYMPFANGSGGNNDYFCGQLATLTTVTDANGNVFNLDTGIDTLGRTAPTSSSSSDTSNCVSSLGISHIGLYSYAGVNNVVNNIKFCYSSFPVATNFSQANVAQAQGFISGELTGTTALDLVATIVLPDQSKWTFNYDGYGEVSQVGLPLGGSISYTWTEIGFQSCAYGDQTLVSRAVASRTLNDNQGHSFIWNYTWGPITNGSRSNTVTDPLGNDTVHVFTALDGQCSFYETRTQYYQGTGGSRQLLKQVDTGYSSAAVPMDDPNASGLGNVFASSIQTTVYPSGKVSLVQRAPDPGMGTNAPNFGVETAEKAYDWGQGTPGPVLRETDYTYEWQSNSAYLAANMLDLPASVVVKDGSGNRMAETDYSYDEPAYLTGSNISTQHGSAPASVRGNLTTVSRWLNTSSSPVVSHTNWYDTGEAYQQIDARGNATTHSYDPAYAGAYATKTCNALSQCVSGTYDFNTGLLTSFTDANASYPASGNTQGDPNHTSNYGYDFMSRMTLAQLPADPAGNLPQTSFTYSAPNVFPLTVQRTRSITASLNDVATSYYDGLGRVYRAQHATPNGNATVDTTYDGLDHLVKVTNPYYSTSDPTYGVIQTQYDALGRATQVTKQDGSIIAVAYHYVPLQAAPGDCTRSTDEAGKQRLACADGLGRLIEVHEPGDNFNGTQSQGSLNIGGSLQTYTIPGTNATYATGSVTISGKEKSMTVGGGTTCLPPPGGCHTNPTATLYDKGTVTITVNGHAYGYNYSGSNATSDSVSTIGSGLQTTINNNSPDVQVTGVTVNATANPPYAVISLQARNAGSGGNFSLSAGATYDSADFTGPSFTTATSGSSLTGGTNGTAPTTVYDSGAVTVTIGSFTASAAYSQGGNSTVAMVASALAGNGPTGLSRSGSPVTASVSGSAITIQYATVGTAGNVSVGCSSATGQGTYFSGPSFTCPATTALNGGYNPEVPSLDFNYFVTQYSYDALGNLLKVTQQGDPTVTSSSQWRVRNFTYDSLSRLLSAINPESGNISYSYDTNGNLLQKTSSAPNQTGAATQTINYCYDALNRITGKAYSATGTTCPLSSPVVTYSYDAGANGIGRLTSLTDQAGSGSYSFDALGRMAGESRTIAGIPKSLAYTYNLDGSVATLSYPSGAVVTYTPWNNGTVATGAASAAVDSGNNISYVTGATYGPDTSLTGFVSGASSSFAGINNSFSYNNRLQPISMSASSPSATVFSIGYDFHLGNGDNGNVYGITNYRNTSRNQTFTYDALNRLTSAQNAGTDCNQKTVNNLTEYWGNSYGYDAWGNLLQKTVTKCGAENLSVTALANNQLVGYSYDAAGNMTHDATTGNNYSYDQENRITGAAGYSYTYDADGNRVEKSNGSTGTVYWYMSPGIVAESDLSGNLKSEYVFFDGERVARKDFPGNSVSYYFSDHLKTASVITDSAGNIKEDEDYYPWGGELQFVNSDANHYKFTSKERDAETGLDYYGARYYSSSFSRFLTPDWSSVPVPVPYANLTNPQTLNQYAFVHNNPMTILDPDGHCCLDEAIDFTVGLLNAWGSDNLAGAGRMEQPTVSGKIGQAVGDLGATVQGAIETGLSGVGELVGIGMDGTGVLAPAGVTVNAVSTAGLIHGSVTTATAGSNFFKDLTGNGGGSKPYEATPENVDKMDKGKAPTGADGNPVELHHPNGEPSAPVQEMTRTDHRLGSNYKQNHPNTNRQPSRIDRGQAGKQRQQHWKNEAKKVKEQKSE